MPLRPRPSRGVGGSYPAAGRCPTIAMSAFFCTADFAAIRSQRLLKTAYGPSRNNGLHKQTDANGRPADSFRLRASIGGLLVQTDRRRHDSMTVSFDPLRNSPVGCPLHAVPSGPENSCRIQRRRDEPKRNSCTWFFGQEFRASRTTAQKSDVAGIDPA